MASFQQQSKRGKLFGTLVNIHASEILFQDMLYSLTTGIAFIEIEVEQHLKHITDNMAGATAQVGKAKLFEIVGVADMVIVTLILVNEIFPLLLKIICSIGIVVKIDTTDGVLYHIFHNPFWSKDLCRRGYLVSIVFALLGKHFILTVGDIELIEPSDKRGRAIVLLRDESRIVEHIDIAALAENVLWKKQLCIVSDGSETTVDDGVAVAKSHDEQGKLLVGLGVIVEQFVEFLACALVHLRHTSMTCLADNQGNVNVLALVLEYGRDEALLTEDADSDETVEPGISSFFSNITNTTMANAVEKRHPSVVERLADDCSHEHGTATEKLRLLRRCTSL